MNAAPLPDPDTIRPGEGEPLGPRYSGWGTRKRRVESAHGQTVTFVFILALMALVVRTMLNANQEDLEVSKTDALLIIFGSAAVLAGMLILMRGASPYIVDGEVYGDRLPLSAIWQRTDLGQFKTSEIARAQVTRRRWTEGEWVEVVLEGPGGRKARFRGFARRDLIRMATESHGELTEEQWARIVAMDGGTTLALKLAAEAGAELVDGANGNG